MRRPLGASVADYLGSSPAHGGIGWGTGPVTTLGLVLFASLVGYLWWTHADEDVPDALSSGGTARRSAAGRDPARATR